MIDWLNLIFNALWLAGCALALATLSIANWDARERGLRLRDRLKQPRVQAALTIAAVLFGAGMAATSQTLLERIAWAALTVACVFLFISSIRSTHKAT
jgi:hypothetical protein